MQNAKGATGTFSNMCGFATPTLAGILTNGKQTIQAWNQVFYITAGVYAFGTFVFVMFGKTSVQPWNTYWEKDEKKQEGSPDEKPALLNIVDK